MISLLGSAQPLGLVLLVTACWLTMTASLEFNICASINTATTARNQSIYQTNGLCHDFCFDDYAYAITQDEGCWCSNYTPDESVQEDDDECSTTCPAFPEEHCGGPDAFAYLELGLVAPSGTKGASPSATSSAEAKTTTATALVTETIQNTVTIRPSETTAISSTSSSSSSTAETTAEPTKTTSMVKTVTADGTVRTVTVAPTPAPGGGTAASDSADSNDNDQGHSTGGGSKGLSTGAVVGIVVGVIGAVLVAAGLGLWFFFRRRKQNKEQAFQEDPSIRGSSAGMGAGRPDMSMSNRSGGAPASPNSAGNRSSMLQIDPRMDPFKQGLYMRSASHESINTLRDDHDYSRRINPPKVLRATNPDPEAET